jgi:hypothetical protein
MNPNTHTCNLRFGLRFYQLSLDLEVSLTVTSCARESIISNSPAKLVVISILVYCCVLVKSKPYLRSKYSEYLYRADCISRVPSSH